MELSGHYDRWREDSELVVDLGLRFLRYGPPLHRTWLDRDRLDFRFSDETFANLRMRNIVPIADLCHFGVPSWIGTFQNADFPELFAVYARTFAQRYP